MESMEREGGTCSRVLARTQAVIKAGSQAGRLHQRCYDKFRVQEICFLLDLSPKTLVLLERRAGSSSHNWPDISSSRKEYHAPDIQHICMCCKNTSWLFMQVSEIYSCTEVLNGIYKLYKNGIISVVRSKRFHYWKFCTQHALSSSIVCVWPICLCRRLGIPPHLPMLLVTFQQCFH